MSSASNPTHNPYAVPSAALRGEVESRATFITRTYVHLLGAVLAFIAIETAIFSSGLAEVIAPAMLSVSWLAILAAFMIVGWLASRVAHRTRSKPLQYLALGTYVLAEALIFVPMLYIAAVSVPGAIASAALLTAAAFVGLTAVAFSTRKDFSFLGGLLRWGMVCALLLIVGGAIFGFQLGVFFSIAMVGLAGAAILYDTSNILHHFPHDRYVGAALQLFASVALMFWYLLSLVMSFSSD